MCLTPEKCLGGTGVAERDSSGRRAAPRDPAAAVGAIPPLGLLILFWWQGHDASRQGRSRINDHQAIPDLPVLDPRTLTDTQVDHCRAMFEDFKDKPLLPANEAYRDETRKALDRELLFGITSVLQLDPGLEEGLDLLRKQWCAEPSVHGGKGTRIDA